MYIYVFIWRIINKPFHLVFSKLAIFFGVFMNPIAFEINFLCHFKIRSIVEQEKSTDPSSEILTNKNFK